MPPSPASTPPARRAVRAGTRGALLRAVYDENRRVLTGEPAPSPPLPPPRAARAPLLGATLLAALLLVALGLTLWGADRGGARAADATGEGSPLPPGQAETWRPADPEAARTTAALYGLEVRTIVLDPGHGGRDPGAIGPTGVREKDVTLEVALRLGRRLSAHPGLRILLTRDDDVWVSKADRVAFANAHGADLFVSIHANALPDPEVASVETYYFGMTDDEVLLRKAARENQGSGYSMAAFRELVARLGASVKLEESRRLAEAIQQSMLAGHRAVDPGVRDWGVRSAPFVVLLGVEAPSVLAEVTVLTHPPEEARLRDPAHLEALAGFLEAGILRYLQGLPFASSPVALDPPAPLHGRQEEEAR